MSDLERMTQELAAAGEPDFAPAAPRFELNWQPFETAPKDGEPIVCFEAKGRFIASSEHNACGEFVDGYDVRWWDDGEWRGYYDAFTGLDNPTHWARLRPPKAD